MNKNATQSMLKKRLKLTIILFIMLLLSGQGWGQYLGSGTFNKITSLTDLTDGYYVVVNSGDAFAMNNSTTQVAGCLGNTVITPSIGVITNPATTIVWLIQTNAGGRTIYSEASSAYVSYTGSSNNVQMVTSVTTDNQRWSFTYASNVFTVTNIALNTRILQYNSASPRFACYTSAQQKLLLYKMVVPTISSPSPASLSEFTTTNGTASASQTFAIGGSNLTANLIVTAATDYEVRENGTSSFGSSVSFTPSSGTVVSKTIEVRIAASAGVGSPSGNIVCSSTNAASQNVAVSGTVNSASSPVITVTGIINTFANTVINTTSTEQIYTLQGSNLSENITVTPPLGFEISKTSGSGFVANPNTLTFTSVELATAQNIYVRFAPSVVQAYSGNITHTTSGAAQIDKVLNGNGIKSEPTDHATFFQATTATPTYSSIIAGWTDAAGIVVPDGYLIKGSSIGYGSITDPSDGTIEADGGLVKNIAQGVGTYQFTGLSPNTSYYLKIYPYTNNGTSINYKIDGSIPQTNIITAIQPVFTYVWNVASGNWNTAASWTPSRTAPATSDILIFDGLIQANPSVTLDFTSPQSIGRIRIINNANVSFATSDVARILNIGYAGVLAPQLEISSGAALTVNAANSIAINVVTGFLGSISGNINFQNAAHKLTAADANGITFNSGSSFTAGTSFSGNAFNTTSLNSIIFASASSYIQEAGGNPFGATQPNSVVVFQSGSLYKLKTTASPAVNGRTFANLEIDAIGFSNNLTGATGFTMDNLILTNCTSVGMNFTEAMNIKGDIIVNSGTLSFSPATATNINLNGSLTQTISGTGILTIASNANFIIDNNVIANRNITFGGTLTINSEKSFTINADKQLTVTGTLTNNAGTSGLILKSNASGTASLIHNTAAVNATVERYITKWTSNTDGWHFVSSPIGTTLIGNFAPGTNDDFYSYDEMTNTWMNYKVSPFGFSNGSAYLAAYETTAAKIFAGNLNTSAVSFTNLSKTIGQGNGWQLMGNPFAAAIKWNDGSNWALSNVNGTAKILNSGGTYTDLAANDIIPAMQGFLVQVIDVTNAITISPASRVHSKSNVLNKTANEEKLIAKVESIGNNTYTESIIKLNDNATNNFDNNYDSHFLEGLYGTPQLYSQMGNDRFSTNCIPSFTGNLVIPMGFVAGLATNYTLSFTGPNSFNNCASIILEDTKTSTFQNLMQHELYNFNAINTDNALRFRLHFISDVGVHEINERTIHIYAFDNTIYIHSKENLKQINVYNTLGQLVNSISQPRQITSFSLNTLPSSYYIVKLTTNKNVYTEKVFVK